MRVSPLTTPAHYAVIQTHSSLSLSLSLSLQILVISQMGPTNSASSFKRVAKLPPSKQEQPQNTKQNNNKQKN